MSKGKAIKQHYNAILKDKEARKHHFSQSGALGDEKEGRDALSNLNVALHNQSVRQVVDFKDINKEASEKVEELKSGKKIIIGSV